MSRICNYQPNKNLFICESKRFKLDLAVLLVYGKSVEVHVTGYIVVYPGVEIMNGYLMIMVMQA